MELEADVEAIFEFIDFRYNNIYEGYRPAHLIEEGYLTTGVHSYYGKDKSTEQIKGTITFVTPEYYPASLWIGKKVEMYEGGTLVGYATITQIFNPVLEKSFKL